MNPETKLLPCPLCGATFLMGQEPIDNHPVGGMFYIFHDYGSLGSAARDCPLEVPRHFNSVEEAVSVWNTRDALTSLMAERDWLRKALKPFAMQGWADENGWTDRGCPNDRICDWFGPSDFRRARAALFLDTNKGDGV